MIVCTFCFRLTYLYVRATKNPKHYNITSKLDRPETMSVAELTAQVDRKLRQEVVVALNHLAGVGLVSMDDTSGLAPTHAGCLMSKYYMAFDTMRNFARLSQGEQEKGEGQSLADLFSLLCESKVTEVFHKVFCVMRLFLTRKNGIVGNPGGHPTAPD